MLRTRRFSPLLALAFVALTACSGRSIRHVPGGSGTGGSASASAGSGSAGDSSSSGGTGSDPDCSYASIARICVIGEQHGEEHHLAAGDPVQVQVTPSRCVSTSCTDTVIDEASISAEADSGPGHFTVDALLCFAPNDHSSQPTSCTPCETYDRLVTSHLELVPGKNTVSLGGLEVTFDVPANVPAKTLCAGLAL